MFVRRKDLKDSDIGSILIRMGVIDQETLTEAVDRQRSSRDLRLGAHLIEIGKLSQDDLSAALMLQKRLRSGEASDVMLEMCEERTERLRKRWLHDPLPAAAIA